MRIGVNALYLIPGGVGGTEIYLRNLLRALAALGTGDEWFVFTNRETGAELTPAGFHAVPLGVAATNRPARMIWEQTVLPAKAWSLGLDVLFNPGFTAPGLNVSPNVTVFHDLQHKVHPEYFRWFDKPAWDFFLWLAAKRSRTLIADSDRTAADLARFYGAGRVQVVPLGVEPEFFAIPRGPVEGYLLCVSTLHPHKNIERLLRVVARMPGQRLVLAGMRGFRTEAIERLAGELGLSDRVRITGWIPRAELYALYRHAAAFVYPSTFEGFGLPVLEAMAAGVPLACSDIEPLRGIVDGHAALFDPQDDVAMLDALRRALSGETATEEARERARLYTWERCARLTYSAISEAGLRAGSSRRSSRRGT